MKQKLDKHFNLVMAILVVLLVLLCFVVIQIGQYGVTPSQVLSALLPAFFNDPSATEATNTVITNIRLPRILLAILAGAGLGVSGAAFQGLFSNPLATPDTLGVAAGASFGATLGILLSFTGLGIQMMAFLMGIVAVGIVFMMGNNRENTSMITIILSGLVVGALFQAFVGLVKYTADPFEQLPTITFWLMGSFAGASFDKLVYGAPLVIAGVTLLWLLRWKINILTLPPDEAKALGVSLFKIRLLVIVGSTIITGATISMCGIVGWVGLLVPHLARMLFGSNNKFVIPASIIIGAIFMVLIDTIARSLTQSEIPISILTAIVGAPMFIVLLRKTGGIKE